MHISPNLFSLLFCGSALYHNNIIILYYHNAGTRWCFKHVCPHHIKSFWKNPSSPQWHSPQISHQTHIIHCKNTLHMHRKKIYYSNLTHEPNLLRVTSFLSCVCTIELCAKQGWGLQSDIRLYRAQSGPAELWAIHTHFLSTLCLSLPTSFWMCASVFGILDCTVLIAGRCRVFYNTTVVTQ